MMTKKKMTSPFLNNVEPEPDGRPRESQAIPAAPEKHG